MKAVPVLLCLALAHGIGASIFKQKDRLIDNFDFLGLKHLRQHRNQPSDNEWYHQHLYHQYPGQHNTHQQEEKHDQGRDQPRPSYRQNLKPDETRQPQYKEQSQNSQEEQVRHYEQPSFDLNHHQQLEVQMGKQYPSHTEQQQSQQNQPTQRNLISYASENSQSPQESQERSQHKDDSKEKLNDDIHGWFSQDSGMSLEDQNTANNDVIERKVHMDVSSSISTQDKEELENNISDAQKAIYWPKAVKQQQLSDKEQMQSREALEHAKQQNQDAKANAMQQAQKHQYPREEHIVKTVDGYVENTAKTTKSVTNPDLETGKILNGIKPESSSTRKNRKTPKSDVSSTMDSHDLDVSSSISAQDKEEPENIYGDAQQAMKQQQLSDKEQMQFRQVLEHAKQQNHDAEANAFQLAQKHQYPREEHIVKTDDGYVENVAKTTESVTNPDLQTGKILNGIVPESSSTRNNRKTPNSDVSSTMDSHDLDVSSSISTQDKEELENNISDAQKAIYWPKSMKQQQLSDKEQMQFRQALEHAKQQNQDAEVNAFQLAQKHQYPREEHIVKTDDGYVENIVKTTESETNPDLQTGKILKWIEPKMPSTRNNRKTPKSDVSSTMDSHHLDVSSSISAQDKEELEKIFSDAQKAMNQLSEKEQMRFHQALEHAKQHNQDAEANATQLVQKHQYPIEEHIVKTDDGYILTLFRITSKIQPRIVFFKRPVVFLMHGLDGSADDWLLMGPKKSLPYLLFDAGYDVWLGNARGNKYSKKHVSMHPAVSDFWHYSIDEIALHDLPAMIDYSLEISKQKKLFYIGHSQGNTAFFGLTAARPEYSDKIIMMYALSPVVYMNNARSPLFRMMSPLSNFYNRLQHQLGNGPFSPNKEFIRAVGGAMLEAQTGCKDVSSNINFVMAGVNISASDAHLIYLVMHHLPAGTSSKLIKHYGQAVASQEFRRYDYGPEVNINVYGKEQPPRYEMEKVKAPVSLYYSEEDWLAHPKDVERLEKELPNVKESHKLSEEHFGNMDFQFSSKAPEMVYKSLMESMKENH